ncbi:MAG: tyrosine-protein phosphatase [Bacillota bacterium]
MIDIHTHILPGVDDGATTIEESLIILENFAKNGVTAAVATSHVAKRRGYPNTTAILQARFDQLVTAKNKAGINIALYLASEVDEQDDLFDIIKGVPLFNNNTVLLDVGMRKCDVESVLYELSIRGYNTIIAHPERIFYFDIELIRTLKKRGALFQVSAPHLIKLGSKNAQKLAKQMLKEQLIDVVATDTHHANQYNDSMKRAYDVVVKKTSAAYAKRIFIENPKIVLGLNE